MSWIQDLYETHEAMERLSRDDAENKCTPVSHTTAKTHVEVVINEQGRFRRAALVTRNESTTVIPCTEKSSTRSGTKPDAHPLSDSLQFLAGDFRERGGQVTSGFEKEPGEPHNGFIRRLRAWVEASPHPSTSAILKYLEEGTLLADLEREGVLPFEEDGSFSKTKPSGGDAHPVWALLPVNQLPENAVVRWKVWRAGQESPGAWADQSLIENWQAYYPKSIDSHGLCMVTGEDASLASFHPAKLRHGGDKAKLISANDTSGFTFRGRFIDDAEACSVGYDVSQKAHSVLRWLIERQGYRNDSQAYVAWTVSGKEIPQPYADLSGSLAEMDESAASPPGASSGPSIDNTRDLGRSYAHKLKKYIAGYGADITSSDKIVVLGLDSATPGRMSILYHRVLPGSEFLSRLEAWHLAMAWPQRLYLSATDDGDGSRGKGRWIWRTGAPTPRAIAEAAYGSLATSDKSKKLHRATVQRILPCIVDSAPLPYDLLESAVRRTCNRVAFKHQSEWEAALGVACALFKGHFVRLKNPDQRRNYTMSLDRERTTRDYLFGRLLAVAENIEATALYAAGEKERPTNAARLMQRFADHPTSTWRTIELALQPYVQRLRVRRGPFMHKMDLEFEQIFSLFQPGDFTDEHRLSGEFLLGYHCQLQILRPKKDKDNDSESAADTEGENG